MVLLVLYEMEDKLIQIVNWMEPSEETGMPVAWTLDYQPANSVVVNKCLETATWETVLTIGKSS